MLCVRIHQLEDLGDGGEGGGAYIGESFTSIGFELHLLLEEPVKDVRPGMRQEKNHLDGVGETYSAAVWDVSDRCEKLSDRGLPSGCWGGADSIAMGFSLGRATYVTSLSAGLDAMAIAMVLVIRVRLNSRGQVASDALRMPGDSGVTLTPRCLFHSAQALQALKDFAGQTRLLALLRDATPGNQGLSPLSQIRRPISRLRNSKLPPNCHQTTPPPNNVFRQFGGPHSHHRHSD